MLETEKEEPAEPPKGKEEIVEVDTPHGRRRVVVFNPEAERSDVSFKEGEQEVELTNEKPVGRSKFQQIKVDGEDIGHIDFIPKGDKAFLNEISVQRDKQGKGVGSKAIKTFFEQHPEFKKIEFGINKESEGFWKKQGATTIESSKPNMQGFKKMQLSRDDVVEELTKNERLVLDTPQGQKTVRIISQGTQPYIGQGITEASQVTPQVLEQVEQIKQSPENVEFWTQVIDNAETLDKKKTIEFKPIKNKLAGQTVVHLCKNCQRIGFLQQGKKVGLVDPETKEEACYGGSCYKDRTVFHRFYGNKVDKYPEAASVSEKPLQFADMGEFEGRMTPQMVEKINKSQHIRMGQAGDDSFAIATGRAKEFFDIMDRKGIKPKVVMITSSYAPVPQEKWDELAKHKDKFVIHFSQSGYFDTGQIMTRLSEMKKAQNAGLNVKVRLITNENLISAATTKDKIEEAGPVLVPNEKMIIDFLQKHKMNNVVLETPFHNDFLGKNARSMPSGKFQSVCCETGKCSSCKAKCLTEQCDDKGLLLSKLGRAQVRRG